MTACDAATYLSGYCTAKLPRAIKHLTWRVPNHPLRQSTGGVLIRDGHALFLIGSDATFMIEWLCKAIKSIYVRKTYYAARALLILDTLRLRYARCKVLVYLGP